MPPSLQRLLFLFSLLLAFSILIRILYPFPHRASLPDVISSDTFVIHNSARSVGLHYVRPIPLRPPVDPHTINPVVLFLLRPTHYSLAFTSSMHMNFIFPSPSTISALRRPKNAYSPPNPTVNIPARFTDFPLLSSDVLPNPLDSTASTFTHVSTEPVFSLLGIEAQLTYIAAGQNPPSLATAVALRLVSISVSLYTLFLVLLAPFLFVLSRRLCSRRRSDPALCPTCSYNLTANQSRTCPECGTAVHITP